MKMGEVIGHGGGGDVRKATWVNLPSNISRIPSQVVAKKIRVRVQHAVKVSLRSTNAATTIHVR